MSDSQFENDISQGIQLLRTGKKMEAARCFAGAVQANPRSGKAWYWLAQSVDDAEKKAFCISKAKELAPEAFEKKPSQPATSSPTHTVATQQAGQIVAEPSKPLPQTPRSPFSEPIPVQPAAAPAQPVQSAAPPGTARPAPIPMYSAPQIDTVSPIQNLRPPEPEPKPGFSLESMFTGLLVAMVLIGLPFAFLAFTGRLDKVFPVPIPTMTQQPAMQSLKETKKAQAVAYTATPYLTPTLTPTPGLEQQILAVSAKMQTAKDKITQMEYTDAIIDLDWIISQVPDYSEAYYYRGLAYYRNIDSLRIQTEYADYMQAAISNFDTAIEIGPATSKEFEYRGYGLIRYASILELTVNRQRLYESALENLQMAYSMPEPNDELPVYIANLYTEIDQCDIGAEQEEELIASGTMSEEMLQKLYSNLSQSYLCLGEYQKALAQLDKTTGCDLCNIFNRAVVLYSMGRKQDAFNLINEHIEKYPHFSGDRYFLRGLIYYDWGQYENAMDDLMTGEGNTWYRGEIYSYLAAMLSYYYGDTESGDAYLEFAAATMYPTTGPYFHNLIMGQLTSRGLEPFSDDSYEFVVTTTPFANGTGSQTPSIPTPMPTLTPTPTLTPQPPES